MGHRLGIIITGTDRTGGLYYRIGPHCHAYMPIGFFISVNWTSSWLNCFLIVSIESAVNLMRKVKTMV